MIRINGRGGNPMETARMENMAALAENNRAIIDYLAMMTDVDIPTEEEPEEETEEESEEEGAEA